MHLYSILILQIASKKIDIYAGSKWSITIFALQPQKVKTCGSICLMSFHQFASFLWDTGNFFRSGILRGMRGPFVGCISAICPSASQHSPSHLFVCAWSIVAHRYTCIHVQVLVGVPHVTASICGGRTTECHITTACVWTQQQQTSCGVNCWWGWGWQRVHYLAVMTSLHVCWLRWGRGGQTLMTLFIGHEDNVEQAAVWSWLSPIFYSYHTRGRMSIYISTFF